jgi:sugar lactone lactonase YvrE
MRRVYALIGIGAIAGWVIGCGSHGTAAPPQQAVALPATAELARAKQAPDTRIGEMELVAEFNNPMQTGVTVSREGRIFINMPRWFDPTPFTVGELKRGRLVAYPDEHVNRYDETDYANTFVSVQSVVVDPSDRLWVLDTGSIAMGPIRPFGPKLVGIDLKTNQIFKKIQFPATVVMPTTYLNDIRFDLRRGEGGLAFITDSASMGPAGLIVVDLTSGNSWRRLSGHPSVMAQPNFTPTVEGQPLMVREPGLPPQPLTIGSDGIAISHDGKTLYYRPLVSHHLYTVSVDALADQNKSDQDVAATVQDLGDIGYASDGLESDNQGNIYLTDYDHQAVHRRDAHGTDHVLVQDPRLIWPDTLSVGHDGYLYISVNQLDRAPRFHNGQDLRQPPYPLFRTKIGAGPVQLKRQTQER